MGFNSAFKGLKFSLLTPRGIVENGDITPFILIFGIKWVSI